MVLPMLTEGDVQTGNAVGTRLICQLWSNAAQKTATIDVVVSVAIANNNTAITRLVRKMIKDSDWTVTHAVATGDAF